jgi:Peptidase MA superfamily
MEFKTCLVICLLPVFCLGQITLEGPVPSEIKIRAVTSEYYRIYRTVAPRQTPDKTPLKIIYYSKTHAGSNPFSLPEWGGGGAIGRDLIVVPVDLKPFLEQSFSQITVHELVHIVLSRGYPGLTIPRWFHEGVAMTLAGELSLQENVGVSKAIFTGSLMPLASIDSVNAFGRNRADLAYSQAHLSVLFLVDQYGIDVVPEILNAARRTKNFWAGLNAALGISPQEFDAMLQKYLTSRYQFVFIFADTYAYWAAIVVLFIIGFIVTGARNRKRAEAMEKEEQRESERLALMRDENSAYSEEHKTDQP